VLQKLDISFLFVSREPQNSDQISYYALNEYILRSHKIIVNASPVGMFPKEDSAPDIPYEFIGKGHLLFDLVYNPAITLFLKKGASRGAEVKNGLEMLHLQADRSWEIWNNKNSQADN
jgi:shikimate dehydrogenase